VCAASGEIAVLKQVALPGIAVSLGAAGIVIVTADLARGARRLLWGEILFFVGLLILLVNHWIAPIVDRAPDLKAAIGRLGGVYRTGDGLPTALMALGTVLVGLALGRLRRQAEVSPSPSPSPFPLPDASVPS